jgi:putative ABC transport system substrate-binding protein
MKKTISSAVLVAMLLACSINAKAQKPAKVLRIGVLMSGRPSVSSARLRAFQQGLRDLGYVEGKNLVIEYRYADGKLDPVPHLAAELVSLNVDVLLTDTSNATQAAKNATKTIPIVFTTANDPVGDGQVASLARPGGNLTGFSILAIDLNGKRLDLLKEAIPKVTRVGFLTRMGTTPGGKRFEEADADAKGLGLRLQFLGAKGVEDLESVFEAAKRAGVQAVLAHPSTFVATNRASIINLAAKSRLPVIYPNTDYVEAGGLMSYGPDTIDNYRRAAGYVDKIVKGTKPADLPVQQPMKFEFAINLKAANAIGLTMPPNLLARADRVIR